MAASQHAEEYSGKEVVPNPLQHSLGPEVDARGIEAVEAQQAPAPSSKTPFWTRRRLILAVLLGLCAVGAIVGGAVGGTVGRRQHGSTEPSATSSPGAQNATMTGSATVQTTLMRYATPISTFGEGTIDIYLQGNDGRVYSKQYINGSWQPSGTAFWILGGIVTSNIAAVSRSLGHTELFARGIDFDIYNQTRNNTDPFGSPQSCLCWDPMNGTAISGPEVSSSSPNSFDVFQYGWDGILYAVPWREASSSSILTRGNWSWLGQYDGLTHDWFNFTPSVISPDVGRYDFFGVRSSDHALYHRAFNEGAGWGVDFEKLGGYCTSRPVAVSVSSSRLDVFVRGGDARVWHTSYDAGSTKGWSQFEPLGNITILGEPHAIRYLGNGISVFVCSQTDNAVWYAVYDGKSWTEWVSLGGDFAAPPKAISKGPGQLDIFAIGRTGELMWRNWNNDRGTWQPPGQWANLGTAPYPGSSVG